LYRMALHPIIAGMFEDSNKLEFVDLNNFKGSSMTCHLRYCYILSVMLSLIIAGMFEDANKLE